MNCGCREIIVIDFYENSEFLKHCNGYMKIAVFGIEIFTVLVN